MKWSECIRGQQKPYCCADWDGQNDYNQIQSCCFVVGL